jgi:hypothetical protein
MKIQFNIQIDNAMWHMRNCLPVSESVFSFLQISQQPAFHPREILQTQDCDETLIPGPHVQFDSFVSLTTGMPGLIYSSE